MFPRGPRVLATRLGVSPCVTPGGHSSISWLLGPFPTEAAAIGWGRGVSAEDVGHTGAGGYLSYNGLPSVSVWARPQVHHFHAATLLTWKIYQHLAGDGWFWELVTWCSVSTRAQKLMRVACVSSNKSSSLLQKERACLCLGPHRCATLLA